MRILAIKAAKEKADYLLAAIGEETGQALKVNEVNSLNPYLGNGSNLNVKGARNENTNYFVDGVKVNGADKAVVTFKKIKLRSSIYVKFEIK